MENQSAQQSDSQTPAPATTETQANPPQQTDTPQPESQPQAPVPEENKQAVAPAAEEKKEEPKVVEAPQNNTPENNTKEEVKEVEKVESAIEPVSQPVSNPVDTTKEGSTPVNIPDSTPVNIQSNAESNPQSNIESNPQVNSQNIQPVSTQAAKVDNVDNAVSNQSSDRLAANSVTQLNSSNPIPQDSRGAEYSQSHSDSSSHLKLFVGGLYYQTEDDVQNYFRQYGKVIEWQLLRHRQTGRSRGFAFVTMEDPTGSIAKQLLSMRNEINGKFVDIKKAEDGKTREKVEKGSCKIFVGGIEGTVSTEELKDFFQNYGEVKEAVVLRNINTNASRGFGFVTFEDSYIANNLIRDNNCVLKGKRMDVKPAEPKDSTTQREPRRREYGGHQGMPPRGGHRRESNYPPPGGYYDKPSYRGGYQSRDKYAPDYYDMPNQYDAYPPPQSRGHSRYSDYAPPPQPMDPTPVATIAPYAPPAPNPPYKGGYAQQQPYGGNYAQPVPPAAEPKMSSYGGSQYVNPGYVRDQPKEPMYGKGYASQMQSQSNYQQYGKHQQNDPYMGGPSRDYGQQSKGHRYKPY